MRIAMKERVASVGYAGARVVEAGGNVNFIARGSRRLARWRFFVPWQMADRFQ